MFRKAAVTKSGQPKYNKVYSKRSKNWRLDEVKEPKSLDFWPTLATRILQKTIKDQISILRAVPVPEDHPKNIAPSIALKPIPKISDLVQRAQSRFVTEQTNIKDAIQGEGPSTS
jgi:23S rRNA A1618 N6-methylase RlmF